MTTEVATQQANSSFKFAPSAPVGKVGHLKALLDRNYDNLRSVLPKHVTPERLIKTMLVAANRNPDLLECTQASIYETISRAAELGLDLSGTLGEAYPVPFNNRIKTDGRDVWVKQCTLIIGYRGLAKLARQSGEIKRIEAEVVYLNDEFQFEKGVEAKCQLRPCLTGDRGDPIGAYALVEFKDGGLQTEFMTTRDIEKVRLRSKSGTDRNGNAIGAWKSDWGELAKKTVFRRLSKWLPLSADKWNRALDMENNDVQFDEVLSAETRPSAKQIADRANAIIDDAGADDDATEGDEPTPVGQHLPDIGRGAPQPQTEPAGAEQGKADAPAGEAAERKAKPKRDKSQQSTDTNTDEGVPKYNSADYDEQVNKLVSFVAHKLAIEFIDAAEKIEKHAGKSLADLTGAERVGVRTAVEQGELTT